MAQGGGGQGAGRCVELTASTPAGRRFVFQADYPIMDSTNAFNA